MDWYSYIYFTLFTLDWMNIYSKLLLNKLQSMLPKRREKKNDKKKLGGKEKKIHICQCRLGHHETSKWKIGYKNTHTHTLEVEASSLFV